MDTQQFNDTSGLSTDINSVMPSVTTQTGAMSAGKR